MASAAKRSAAEHWGAVRSRYLGKKAKEASESGVTLDGVALPIGNTLLEPLRLPHGRPSTHLVRAVEMLGPRVGKAAAKLLLAPHTCNLLAGMFWYILAVHFKRLPQESDGVSGGGARYKATLFDHMCCWYALVFQGIPSATSKDNLLKDYAGCLSLATFFAYQNSFPYDLESFDARFMLSMQSNVSYWITGMVMSAPCVSAWSRKGAGPAAADAAASSRASSGTKTKQRLTKRQMIQRSWAATMGDTAGSAQTAASAASPSGTGEGGASSRHGSPPPPQSLSGDGGLSMAEIAQDLYFARGAGSAHSLYYGRPGQPVVCTRASKWELPGEAPAEAAAVSEDASDEEGAEAAAGPTDAWANWMGRATRGVFCLDAGSPLLRRFLGRVARSGTKHMLEGGGSDGGLQVRHGALQAGGSVDPPGTGDSAYARNHAAQFVSSRVLSPASRRAVRSNILTRAKTLHEERADYVHACVPQRSGGLLVALKEAAASAVPPSPQPQPPQEEGEEDGMQQRGAAAAAGLPSAGVSYGDGREWMRRFDAMVTDPAMPVGERRALQAAVGNIVPGGRVEDRSSGGSSGSGGGGRAGVARPASAPPTTAKTMTRSGGGSGGLTGVHPVATNLACDPSRAWVPIDEQYCHMSNLAKVQLHASHKHTGPEARLNAVSPVPLLHKDSAASVSQPSQKQPQQRKVAGRGFHSRHLLNHRASSNRVGRSEGSIGWQGARHAFDSAQVLEAARTSAGRSALAIKGAKATWERAEAVTGNQQEETQKSLILLTAENERVLARLEAERKAAAASLMKGVTCAVDRINATAKANSLLDSIVAVNDLLCLINRNVVAASADARDVLLKYATRATAELRGRCREARLQFASHPRLLLFLERVEASLKASGAVAPKQPRHRRTKTTSGSIVGATAAEEGVQRARAAESSKRRVESAAAPRLESEAAALLVEARQTEESYLRHETGAGAVGSPATPGDGAADVGPSSALQKCRAFGFKLGAAGGGAAHKKSRQSLAAAVVGLLGPGGEEEASATAAAPSSVGDVLLGRKPGASEPPVDEGLTIANLGDALLHKGEALKGIWRESGVEEVETPPKAGGAAVPPGMDGEGLPQAPQPPNAVPEEPSLTDRFLSSPLLKQWRKVLDLVPVVDEADLHKKRELFDRLASTLDKRSRAACRQTKVDFGELSAIDGYVVWSETAVPVGSSSEELIQVCPICTVCPAFLFACSVVINLHSTFPESAPEQEGKENTRELTYVGYSEQSTAPQRALPLEFCAAKNRIVLLTRSF